MAKNQQEQIASVWNHSSSELELVFEKYYITAQRSISVSETYYKKVGIHQYNINTYNEFIKL